MINLKYIKKITVSDRKFERINMIKEQKKLPLKDHKLCEKPLFTIV